MRLHLAGFAVISMLCAGCHGPGSVDGTIRGKPFEVADAVSITVVDDNDNSFGVVALSTRPDLCDAIGNGVALKNAQLMSIQVGLYAPARDVLTAPTGAGDFAVYDPARDVTGGAIALVDYVETDARCQIPQHDVLATKGTISISSVGDDGAYAGSGKVMLDTGDSIELDFSASPCNALPGFVLGQDTLTGCQ